MTWSVAEARGGEGGVTEVNEAQSRRPTAVLSYLNPNPVEECTLTPTRRVQVS